jgi:ubiquinone/menaquinone biosynthesis C-methylase UbiE
MIPDLATRLRQRLAPAEHAALGRAYRLQQAAIRYPLLATHALARVVAGRGKAPPRAAVRALRREYEALLARDLRNVADGLYPSALLFQIPWADHALAAPRFLADLPRIVARVQRGDFKDVPDTEGRRFPGYFRRTFHWQSDGYLSERSARIYDLTVELLFLGCGDVMRRQVIPPMTHFARRRTGAPLRILDVGCGTGRTLAQIASAVPGQQYFGVDLSPWYVECARRNLARVPEVTLLADNAEKLPFRDEHFDVVTSTYLFHELPRRARRRVAAELARVLRPGGLLVIEDSAQRAEASDLAFFLEAFSKRMHEPYYRDYVRDDLSALFEEQGLEVGPVQRAWLSKVVGAQA